MMMRVYLSVAQERGDGNQAVRQLCNLFFMSSLSLPLAPGDDEVYRRDKNNNDNNSQITWKWRPDGVI
jgi:hypothetical protein